MRTGTRARRDRGGRSWGVRIMARGSGGHCGRFIRCGHSGRAGCCICSDGKVRNIRANRAATRCKPGRVEAVAVSVVVGRCEPWRVAAAYVPAAVTRCETGCAAPIPMKVVDDGYIALFTSSIAACACGLEAYMEVARCRTGAQTGQRRGASRGAWTLCLWWSWWGSADHGAWQRRMWLLQWPDADRGARLRYP